MIHREGPQTRVERVEWRVWAETGAIVVICVFLSVYVAVTQTPGGPGTYLTIAGVAALAAVLVVGGLRRRPVCIIEPSQVGYGFLNGKMWWLPRDRIGAVTIRQSRRGLEVGFYDRDGGQSGSIMFSRFDPKELRQVFESAGIPIR